jgi:hypothetical protein
MLKRNLIAIAIVGSALIFSANALGQPTDAQIKKSISGVKTVSVTLGNPGTVEWSSTYKKYMWTRNFTAKVKTDTAGEFVIVKGYAAYDVIGGKYVYWRTFTSSNSYEGKKNPTNAEINEVLKTAETREFDRTNSIIGEFESFKMSDDPMWEWHSPTSVSFNAIGIFNIVYRGGSYGGEATQNLSAGMTIVDKVEAIWRIRLYRADEKSPWNKAFPRRYGMNTKIPNSKNEMIRPQKLLERNSYPSNEVQKMTRMNKVPSLK